MAPRTSTVWWGGTIVDTGNMTGQKEARVAAVAAVAVAFFISLSLFLSLRPVDARKPHDKEKGTGPIRAGHH